MGVTKDLFCFIIIIIVKKKFKIEGVLDSNTLKTFSFNCNEQHVISFQVDNMFFFFLKKKVNHLSFSKGNQVGELGLLSLSMFRYFYGPNMKAYNFDSRMSNPF